MRGPSSRTGSHEMRNEHVSEIGRERARQLRREQTPQEAVLWTALRSRRSGGVKFRRQVPVGPFILDFYCVAAKLAVEVDGWVHDEPDRRASDRRRTRWLFQEEGIEVIRFSNEEVVMDVGRICEQIVREVETRTKAPSPPAPLPLGEGRSTVKRSLGSRCSGV